MKKRSIVIATVTMILITSQIFGCGGLWSRNEITQVTIGDDTASSSTGTQTERREDTYGFGSVQAGDYVYFGTYEQDDDLTNGAEPIQWKVMAVEDGRALLMSVYSLEYVQYNSQEVAATWEESDLRSWMNHDFYDSAFTQEEKEWIQLSTLQNPGSPFYGTEGGNPTQDYVFTVSLDEIQQHFSLTYSDEYSGTEWLAFSEDLLSEVTLYALNTYNASGPDCNADPSGYIEWDWDSACEEYYGRHYGLTGDMLRGKEYDEWWTRTPGRYDESDPDDPSYCRAFVFNYGIAGYASGRSVLDALPARVFVWVDTK